MEIILDAPGLTSRPRHDNAFTLRTLWSNDAAFRSVGIDTVNEMRSKMLATLEIYESPSPLDMGTNDRQRDGQHEEVVAAARYAIAAVRSEHR